MKNDNASLQTIGLSIISLAILGAIIWGLFYGIGKAPWQFITILVAALGALITVAGNLNIQIRNEQRPKKFEVYDKIIKLFFDSLFSSKSKSISTQEEQEEIARKVQEITPDLILWASDDVLNLYIKFRQVANSEMEDSSNTSILLFSQLLLAMRKDLGNQNNKLDEVSILGTFVNDVEKLAK